MSIHLPEGDFTPSGEGCGIFLGGIGLVLVMIIICVISLILPDKQNGVLSDHQCALVWLGIILTPLGIGLISMILMLFKNN